jgi:hypothetical protein
LEGGKVWVWIVVDRLKFLEDLAIFEPEAEYSLQRDKSEYLDRINRIQRHVEPEISLMVKERNGDIGVRFKSRTSPIRNQHEQS